MKEEGDSNISAKQLGIFINTIRLRGYLSAIWTQQNLHPRNLPERNGAVFQCLRKIAYVESFRSSGHRHLNKMTRFIGFYGVNSQNFGSAWQFSNLVRLPSFLAVFASEMQAGSKISLQEKFFDSARLI